VPNRRIQTIRPRKHHFACAIPEQGSACGISDIVKRRSIRVGSRKTIARFITISRSFRRSFIAR